MSAMACVPGARHDWFRRAVFIKSADAPRDLPIEALAEVAFAGRSNAGKSSVLNALADRRGLAVVSKSPGRTRYINFFAVGEGRFMVDLPGYGYAQVPGPMRDHWQGLVSAYLISRPVLCGLVVVMDVRHPLTPLDARMLAWFAARERPTHLLLTKSDKLTRQQAIIQLRIVEARLRSEFHHCSVQLFSSVSGQGLEEARSVVYRWLFRDEKRNVATGDNQKEAPAEGESDRG